MEKESYTSIKNYDIAIIGGGASGLVAAIKAKSLNPELSVLVIEKMDAPGRKVAASGNGRCNLSNIKCDDWERTSAFFSSIGLLTRVDEAGRIYPYSEDGRDVVRILIGAAEKLDIDFMLRRKVKEIAIEPVPEKGEQFFPGNRFQIFTEFVKPKAYRERPEDGPVTVIADRLLIAAGGKSKPKLGTSGDGYVLAKRLGHSINKLIPILTGVNTEEDIKSMGLSGIREKCLVRLKNAKGVEDRLLFQDSGEIQFTDYGISGIVVFDMTRFMDIDTEGEGTDSAVSSFSDFEIEIDFLPEFSETDVKTMIEEAPDPETGICSMVKDALAKTILAAAGGIAENLAYRIKHFTLHPTGLKGWEMAQVTRGGVPLSEIDTETGESKMVPGLFFSGEILDCDGPCGGFNLQHAWTSGLRAGTAMGGRYE